MTSSCWPPLWPSLRGATTAAVPSREQNSRQDESIIHESSVRGYIYTFGAVGMPDANHSLSEAYYP